jgi:hypothetical protein
MLRDKFEFVEEYSPFIPVDIDFSWLSNKDLGLNKLRSRRIQPSITSSRDDGNVRLAASTGFDESDIISSDAGEVYDELTRNYGISTFAKLKTTSMSKNNPSPSPSPIDPPKKKNRFV